MNIRRLVLCPAFVLAACTATGRVDDRVREDDSVLPVPRASAAPRVDGESGDAAWSGVKEIAIPLTRAAGGPHEVYVRAAVHDDVLYLLARWQDDTEDRAHKPWTLAPDGRVASGPEREDVFAIAFPISGEFTADMLAPVECVWDVWQWKSARTDAAGFAMDKTHVHGFADPGGRRHAEELPDGRTLYIRRPEDDGTSATRSIAAPAPPAAPTPQYAAQVPTGSAGDVRARGTWRGGWWTLELARPLYTGHPDDVDLRGAWDSPLPFGVAILDRAEDDEHATSEVWRLRFVRE